MSQNCYKERIIELLLKKHNHIRGLARDLKTNQTTISRKIKELEKENIVDYVQEGSNKVYHLKKSIEAKQYVLIIEHHKLNQIIKKYPLLRNIIQKIQQHPKIQLALLFGSYAKKIAHEESDIDIYIETTNNELKKEIESLNTKLSIKIGKYNKNSILIKEIEKNHAVIKGTEKYYEKNKFFE